MGKLVDYTVDNGLAILELNSPPAHAYGHEMMRDLDDARVRALIDEFYEQFLGKVAAARGMTPDEVDALAQGRVWTGEQAVENGLVDELGGFNRALELVKEKAKIPSSESVQLVEFPRPKPLWELLLSHVQRGELRGLLGSGARLPAPLDQWLTEWWQMTQLAQQPLWALLPATFAFR